MKAVIIKFTKLLEGGKQSIFNRYTAMNQTPIPHIIWYKYKYTYFLIDDLKPLVNNQYGFHINITTKVLINTPRRIPLRPKK